MDHEASDSIKQANDAIQRALNRAKAQEIREKYGPSFSSVNPDIDPELEAEFLNYVEEFERQWQHADTITVWEFIGKPEILPIEGLTFDEMRRELGRIYAIMEENQMHLDCVNEVDIRDLYKFVSGDFMKVECDNIRIPGMRHGFIYEEFFPEK